jgi:hypothetical protein
MSPLQHMGTHLYVHKLLYGSVVTHGHPPNIYILLDATPHVGPVGNSPEFVHVRLRPLGRRCQVDPLRQPLPPRHIAPSRACLLVVGPPSQTSFT